MLKIDYIKMIIAIYKKYIIINILKINGYQSKICEFYLSVLKLLSKLSYVNYHVILYSIHIVLFIECVSRYSNGIPISLGRLNHRLFL